LVLSAFVAIHVTIVAAYLLKTASMSQAAAALFLAWLVQIPLLAMLGAAAFLALTFASIQSLRPNVAVYVLAGIAAGAAHFWFGTLFSLESKSTWMVLIYMVGGFWMSNPTSSGAINIVGFYAQLVGGALAGITFALSGTRQLSKCQAS
jgi:hypothetical protein